jgi:hypothetical protein
LAHVDEYEKSFEAAAAAPPPERGRGRGNSQQR